MCFVLADRVCLASLTGSSIEHDSNTSASILLHATGQLHLDPHTASTTAQSSQQSHPSLSSVVVAMSNLFASTRELFHVSDPRDRLVSFITFQISKTALAHTIPYYALFLRRSPATGRAATTNRHVPHLHLCSRLSSATYAIVARPAVHFHTRPLYPPVALFDTVEYADLDDTF